MFISGPVFYPAPSITNPPTLERSNHVLLAGRVPVVSETEVIVGSEVKGFAEEVASAGIESVVRSRGEVGKVVGCLVGKLCVCERVCVCACE